jgi:hypothetical protein
MPRAQKSPKANNLMYQELKKFEQKPGLKKMMLALSAVVALTSSSVTIWSSSPVLMNETAVIRTPEGGGGYNASSSLKICASQQCEELELIQPWAQGTKFVVPPALPLGVWEVQDVATNESITTLNKAEGWWAICEDASVSSLIAGAVPACQSGRSVLRVFGRSIGFDATAASPCLAYELRSNGSDSARLRLSREGADVVINAQEASCYEASFILPESLPPGDYTMEITNQLPGRCAARDYLL